MSYISDLLKNIYHCSVILIVWMMKRRQILKGIAAGSTASVGISGASAQEGPTVTDIEQYDRLYVLEEDTRVGTVENPTWDDVKQVESELDDSQTLVTPDGQCSTFCCDQCSCSDCACGCSNCCDPDNEICSGCDDS